MTSAWTDIRLPQAAASSSRRARGGTGCRWWGKRWSCSLRDRRASLRRYPHHRSTRDWQSVLFFPVGIYILAGARPEHRRRLTRPARPRLRRVLRGRRLHDGDAHDRHGLVHCWEALLLAIVVGDARRRDPRHARRCACAATTSPSSRSGFGEIVRITAQNSAEPRRGRAASPASPTRRASATSQLRDRTPLPVLLPRACVASSSSILMVRAGSKHRRVGRAWAAIREDEDAAELMGVPTFRLKLWAFAMGAVGRRARRAGSTPPRSRSSTRTTSRSPVSILILAAVVLGGARATPGRHRRRVRGRLRPEYLRDAAARHARLPERRHRRHASDITEYRVLPLRRRARAHDDLPSAGPASRAGSGPPSWPSHRHRRAWAAPVAEEAEVADRATSTTGRSHEVSRTDVELPEEPSRAAEVAETVLELRELHAWRFGGVVALNDVSI